jgi:hypothetical protein
VPWPIYSLTYPVEIYFISCLIWYDIRVYFYCNWVSTWWQWSVNLYKNSKQTAIYKRKNNTTKQYKNKEYTKYKTHIKHENKHKKNTKGLSSMQLVASPFVSSTLPPPYPHHSHFFDTLLLTSHKRPSLLTDEEVLYATPTWRRCNEGLPCTRNQQHTTPDSRAGWVPQTICLTL